MVGYSHLSFICSQDEDYAGSENFFQQPNQFASSAFRSYNPNSSSTDRNLIGEFEPCEDNIDVGGKEVDEGSDVQIVEPSAKPLNKKRDAVGKKKAPTKRRATKVNVKREEKEEGEKKKNWLDNEVEHLIALRGEM